MERKLSKWNIRVSIDKIKTYVHSQTCLLEAEVLLINDGVCWLRTNHSKATMFLCRLWTQTQHLHTAIISYQIVWYFSVEYSFTYALLFLRKTIEALLSTQNSLSPIMQTLFFFPLTSNAQKIKHANRVFFVCLFVCFFFGGGGGWGRGAITIYFFCPNDESWSSLVLNIACVSVFSVSS